MKEEQPSFLLEADFHEDTKFLEIEQELGEASCYKLLKLVGKCRKLDGYRIKRTQLKPIAYSLHAQLQDLELAIDLALKNGLMVEDDKGLGFPALDRRMEKFEAKREQAREAGLKSAERRRQGGSGVVPSPSLPHPTTVNDASACPSTDVQRPLNGSATSRIEIQTQIPIQKEIQTEKEKPKPKESPPILQASADPPEDDPFLAEARKKLEEPDGTKPWERSTVFINTGRRPLKSYPDLWFTPVELAEVVKKYDESGIPIVRFKEALTVAQGRVTTMKAKGESPERISAVNWLLGFIRNDMLELINKETRLKKTEGRA